VTTIPKNESHQLIESPIKVMATRAQVRKRRLGMRPTVAAGCPTRSAARKPAS
jgi:hypothetical protein